MWYFFYIFFISVSIVYVPFKVPDQWWVPKEALFLCLGTIFTFSSLITGKKQSFQFRNHWLFSACCYTMTLFFFNFFIPIIFNNGIGYEIKIWNLRPTLNFIIGILIIKTLVENTDSFKRWVTLSKVLVWTSFIISCYTLIQWLGIDPLFQLSDYSFNFRNGIFERKVLMVGFLANKFLTSNYISIISPVCLLFKGKRYKFAYSVMFLSVFLSDCASSTAVFLGCGVLFLLLSGRYKSFILSVIVSSITVIISMKIHVDFLSSSARTILWKDIFSDWMGRATAFLGTSLGGFPASGFKSGGKEVLSAHNEYIQILFEGGVPLLVICVCYLITLYSKLFKTFLDNRSGILIVYACSFTGYLFLSLFSFPLRIAPLALIGIIYIAVLETLILNRRNL